jgi:hypothetical protein
MRDGMKARLRPKAKNRLKRILITRDARERIVRVGRAPYPGDPNGRLYGR